MSSFSILPNLAINRFHAIRGLSSTTFLPNPGDIFSTDTVRLIFVRQSNATNKYKKVNWIGKIKITINSIESLPNSLYKVNSKMSFDNEVPSEIQIQDIYSDEQITVYNFNNTTNVINLQENNMILSYIDGLIDEIEDDNYKSVRCSGNLYSEDYITNLDIQVNNQNYTYTSSSFITFKRNTT